MTLPPPRTVETPRQEASSYLSKAKEFLSGARQGLVDDRPNGAALEAVHAVICACDALTVWHLHKRSRAADHREVIRLLREIPGASKSSLGRQVLEVLSAKSAVEYGGEGISDSGSKRIVLQAERIVEWVANSVDSTRS